MIIYITKIGFVVDVVEVIRAVDVVGCKVVPIPIGRLN
jgi:hypothetical protein